MVSDIWLDKFLAAVKQLVAECEKLDVASFEAQFAMEEINTLLDLIGERDEE